MGPVATEHGQRGSWRQKQSNRPYENSHNGQNQRKDKQQVEEHARHLITPVT